VVYQIVYSSISRKVMNSDSIFELLTKAQAFNKEHGITGLLIYHSSVFLQLLEGEEKEVKELYQKILKDPRHSDMLILLEAKSETRLFDIWSMAYKKIEDITPELLGELIQVTKEISKNKKLSDSSKMMKLLKQFRFQM